MFFVVENSIQISWTAADIGDGLQPEAKIHFLGLVLSAITV